MRLRTATLLGAWATAALCLLELGGCNIVSAVSFVARPEPEVEAKYDLQDVPTVVFLDDRRNRISPTRLRRVIAEEATTVLMEEGVVSRQNMVPARDAIRVSSRHDRAGKLLSVHAIGEAVGAEQIIYVSVDEFALTRDGQTPEPKSICRVRVIDVKDEERLFPDPASDNSYGYYQLVVDLPNVDPHGFHTISIRNDLNDRLAVATGDEIAKLFFTYTVSELGGRIEPR
ncbi:MAG: hypothetical protein CMJ41_01585 [Phycisphaerae bacterium]|nr:hypothetical protein [Phycisphaerae bacterium]